MPRIIVDEHYCKGCSLCVEACPKDCIALDESRITPKGYHPAVLTDESLCTGCIACALMCPEVAITVVKGA